MDLVVIGTQIFFLLTLLRRIEPLENAVMTTCCTYGKDWYRISNGECPVFEGTVPTVSVEDQDRCRSVVTVCCFKVMSRARCSTGVSIATENDNQCSARLRMRDGGYFINECCHCCRLGILTRRLGAPCSNLYPIGLPCRDAYRACCTNSQYEIYPTQIVPTSSIDECALYDNICDQICINTVESYRCACREGWVLNEDGNTCRLQNNGPTNTIPGTGGGRPQAEVCTFNTCDHVCSIRLGKAVCSCRHGYQLMPDKRTCRDVDECAADANICGTGQQCVNTDGGFTCNSVFGPTCLEGHTYNAATEQCDPVSVAATCPIGFTFDRNLGRCLQNPTSADCPTGYQFNTTTRRCEDFDECASSDAHRCTKDQESCRNTLGSFLCQCAVGYEYDVHGVECKDVNECARQIDTCVSGQQCENTIGSYHCARTVSCGTGYTLNKDTQVCEDNDECLLNTANCGNAFTCTNIPGSFRCTVKECPDGFRLNLQTGQCQRIECPDGFQGDTYGQCVDIDECSLQPGPCAPEQVCINSIGSFWCRQVLNCGGGYELDEAGRSCKDIDECTAGTHNCKSSEVCQNRPGTFLCQCPTGYDKNPRTEFCEDVDECERYSNQVCADSADCVNTPGSYICRCKKGFRSIQNTATCIDVNECLIPGTCEHHCVNSWGSFQCTCREGYEIAEDRRSCQDIDECTVWGSSGRLCPGQCENTQGSYRCACPDGYTLQSDGKGCTDIDECALGTSGCTGQEQTCFNTRGNFRCLTVACPTGYIRTPSSGTKWNERRTVGTPDSPWSNFRDEFSSQGLRQLVSLGDEGIVCTKRKCPRGDIDCFLNNTNTVTYQYISLPTIDFLAQPLTLLRVRTVGYSVFSNVRFTMVEGGEGGFFDVIRQGDRGAVRLLKPVTGPIEFRIKLLMDSRNGAGYVISRHIAFILVHVSRWTI